MDAVPAAFCLRATPFGPVAVLWSVYRGEPRIDRILLSRPGASAAQAVRQLFPNAPASSCAQIDTLLDRITALLHGEAIQFSLDGARLDLCSPFQQLVLRAEHAVPRGRVTTYGLLAKHLGRPGAARAVGAALANNPFPLIIPCHRAIRFDGALGGYQGGPQMKRALLEMEGIAFRAGDRVAAQDFFYGGLARPARSR